MKGRCLLLVLLLLILLAACDDGAWQRLQLKELERMNKLINDLLSLVRMDKNASQINITEINVNEFVEKILKQL